MRCQPACPSLAEAQEGTVWGMDSLKDPPRSSKKEVACLQPGLLAIPPSSAPLRLPVFKVAEFLVTHTYTPLMAAQGYCTLLRPEPS